MFQPSKRLTALGSALVLFLAMSAVASCSGPSGTPSPATSNGPLTGPTSGSAPPTATPTATTDAAEFCGAGSAIHYDRSAFQPAPRIDNKWFPLKPGMQYTTKGMVKSADGTTERTVVHSVTGLTKVIDGVKTLVMWDRDYYDGQLVESELAFFAQTEKGAVWLFGEYPEEYENGTFTGAPRTFIHGISKAQAGIAMQDQPVTGTPGYVQAHAPDVGFLDCGTVFKQHERVCVPAACYDDVLTVDEYNPLEPSVGHQQKLYSAGTGLVKVTAIGGADQESLDLIKAEALADSALTEINRQALELDGHAYQVSASVYGTTPRAEVATPGSSG
ncbi:conserved hypothetical protein [Arthrobacter sp. Hiyo8]|uniref:hypothetical protein n=1 Tax=Arthrobacter sp. Hiyo1 TaxID=1588020 RepID=UPI0006839D97|nr:hypothetical protein [Arthrobacter sp. Hiyo1]BAS17853.1 conserved hypothetical protein [Arthrobacter sp. Hiyo8]GAP60229.1 conserved hypothetical protein [Arthrobacter sp. Hiyo1]